MGDKRMQNETWRIFRIVSEFVDGFETMQELGPAVAFFGSARVKEDHPYYKLAEDLAFKIASYKIGIVTGGGPGIMMAANKGCQKAGAKSCGVAIKLPFEEDINPFVDRNHSLSVRYYFVRKVLLVRYALAFIILPGGVGTLDELFEVVTLIQTKKVKPFPIFLIGTKYWKKMLDWIKESPIAEGFLSENDLDIFQLTDDLDYVADQIYTHYKIETPHTNFELGGQNG
jgi:uncharacterized protein (TIGR00730 family)